MNNPNSEPRRSYTSFTGPTGVEDAKDYDPTAALERFEKLADETVLAKEENWVTASKGDLKDLFKEELLLAYKKGREDALKGLDEVADSMRQFRDEIRESTNIIRAARQSSEGDNK